MVCRGQGGEGDKESEGGEREREGGERATDNEIIFRLAKCNGACGSGKMWTEVGRGGMQS